MSDINDENKVRRAAQATESLIDDISAASKKRGPKFIHRDLTNLAAFKSIFAQQDYQQEIEDWAWEVQMFRLAVPPVMSAYDANPRITSAGLMQLRAWQTAMSATMRWHPQPLPTSVPIRC